MSPAQLDAPELSAVRDLTDRALVALSTACADEIERRRRLLAAAPVSGDFVLLPVLGEVGP